MNLAMLTSQIPLIELGVIASFVLMHFARTFLIYVLTYLNVSYVYSSFANVSFFSIITCL